MRTLSGALVASPTRPTLLADLPAIGGHVIAAKRHRVQPREKPQQIADELRALIVSGELSEGDSLGREPELVERFGVSRPSLREALRILEAEGLITVLRGAGGGVVVHEPDERMMARAAAMVLASRGVALADVFAARTLVEPLAAGALASLRARRSVVTELRELVQAQEDCIGDPEQFAAANTKFHERLVSLAGNETLGLFSEMLNEIVTRAVTEVSRDEDGGNAAGSLSVRRRGIRSQLRLLELIKAGDRSATELHWRAHMAVVGRVMLGQRASAVVDLLDDH
jgi:GntR family transcriptional repressor for pyruvate dehydrogenase complex